MAQRPKNLIVTRNGIVGVSGVRGTQACDWHVPTVRANTGVKAAVSTRFTRRLANRPGGAGSFAQFGSIRELRPPTSTTAQRLISAASFPTLRLKCGDVKL